MRHPPQLLTNLLLQRYLFYTITEKSYYIVNLVVHYVVALLVPRIESRIIPQ